jgi:hypothetical protein
VTVWAMTSGQVILRNKAVRRFEVTVETAIPAIRSKNTLRFLTYFLLSQTGKGVSLAKFGNDTICGMQSASEATG